MRLRRVLDCAVLDEVQVHGAAGDAQHLGDVGGRDALLPELTGFSRVIVVDLAGPAELGALAREAFPLERSAFLAG
jgi:hypothetical protein